VPLGAAGKWQPSSCGVAATEVGVGVNARRGLRRRSGSRRRPADGIIVAVSRGDGGESRAVGEKVAEPSPYSHPRNHRKAPPAKVKSPVRPPISMATCRRPGDHSRWVTHPSPGADVGAVGVDHPTCPPTTPTRSGCRRVTSRESKPHKLALAAAGTSTCAPEPSGFMTTRSSGCETWTSGPAGRRTSRSSRCGRGRKPVGPGREERHRRRMEPPASPPREGTCVACSRAVIGSPVRSSLGAGSQRSRRRGRRTDPRTPLGVWRTGRLKAP
jgi:hypothetical protein